MNEDTKSRVESDVAMVESVINEFSIIEDGAINSVLASLKEGCTTYGEVSKRLSKLIRQFSWTTRNNDVVYFLRKVESALEREKNDLPLTNRSSGRLRQRTAEAIKELDAGN